MPSIAEDALPQWSLLKLRAAVSESERSTLTFRLEGVVCASNNSRGLIAVDDGTTTDLLEVPSLPDGLQPGDGVIIQALESVVSRGPLAIHIGSEPLVNLDGRHPPLTRSRTVFLHEGMRQVRLEWFNAFADVALKLEYEGPGMARRQIPKEALCHAGPGGVFPAGLLYSSYIADDIYTMPRFSKLDAQGRGVVADFDPSVRARPEMAGIVFSGFLRVPRTGLYNFNLTSDDGARLFVVDNPVTCELAESDRLRAMAPDPPQPDAIPGTSTSYEWVTLEGTVNYAAVADDRMELELSRNTDTLHVTFAEGSGLDPSELLHRRVKIKGIKRESGILAIDSEQVQIIPDGQDVEKILTKAVEVRQLQPSVPVKFYPASIQGVVTRVSGTSLVIQDATGGVFVAYRSSQTEHAPQPAELWRLEGKTAPGDFSPILHQVTRATYLGPAPLPKPVQPTQQQLASGSLDAERVEIEGVVTEVSDLDVKLLTPSGRVRILQDDLYTFPAFFESVKERTALVGAVVRLRGVYRAIWDTTTGTVHPGEMMLGNVTISIDEPASRDVYSAPLVRPSDLLLFTSHSNAFRRVKVSGQLLYSRPPELFLFDGTRGFRVLARDSSPWQPGDFIESSGFPRLGGPSPELLEARARKKGAAPLPRPSRISAADLPDTRLDSTLVEIEATLLSDTVRLDERALEMRAGPSRFVAFVPTGKSPEKGFERGSILKLTGVYISSTSDRTLSSSDPFELRLHDSGSIAVIKRGPWWTTRHTIGVIAILSGGLVLAVSWVTLLRRTVARRSTELAVEIEERESAERSRAMERERTRMARDLHDELGSGLTEAGILSSLIRNPEIPGKQKDRYLDQLNGLCCTLVTGLDEIVWAVNPRYDSVADLAGYFSLYAQRFLKLGGIACRLGIEEAITDDPLDSRMRHGIFLAFKEALNNIVRHSRATKVHLVIKAADGSLAISLADNGRGFNRIDLPGSDGLHNIEERVRGLGGTCAVESVLDKGTTITFKLMLKGLVHD